MDPIRDLPTPVRTSRPVSAHPPTRTAAPLSRCFSPTLAAAAVLFAVGCAGGRGADRAPGLDSAALASIATHVIAGTPDELIAADRAFAADSRARGAAAWAAVWAARGRKEDGRGRQVVGPRAVAESVASMLERVGPRFRWEPDTAAMLWPDTLGYTAGRWWIEPERAGPPPAAGRYLTAWIRENGAWRVALDLATPEAARCRGGGAGGFDFWLGRWSIAQRFASGDAAARPLPARTVVSRAGPCALAESWQGEVLYFWAGMRAPHRIRGASLRAWDPDAGRWRIYWIDTAAGAFGAPFRGAFTDGLGEFEAPPRAPGGPARRIRFARRGDAVLWELAARPRGGSWTTVWTMEQLRR